jgi:hypothetical protein
MAQINFIKLSQEDESVIDVDRLARTAGGSVGAIAGLEGGRGMGRSLGRFGKNTFLRNADPTKHLSGGKMSRIAMLALSLPYVMPFLLGTAGFVGGNLGGIEGVHQLQRRTGDRDVVTHSEGEGSRE